MEIVLSRPPFGTTAISKVNDNKIVYSTVSLHEINIGNTLTYDKNAGGIPMMRRIKVIYE
ncbi:MAG: hypothetical protein OWQ54_00220 [Sulfolobaceae archaeon]|nr:hypothetical protein [Sulfolobaceae archaeon]